MSYKQIRHDNGFITRSPTLSPIARLDGYPGYMAMVQDNRGLVRTILYEDDTGIYLTKRKRFKLTTGQNGNLIFSASPEAEPLIPEGPRLPWYDDWANMANSDSKRSDLIHPYISATDIWDILVDRGYSFTLDIRNKGSIAYTRPCNIFTCQNYGYFVAGDTSATFKVKKYGDRYGLSYRDVGNTIGGGTYDVRCWNSGDACRWMIYNDVSASYPVMKFTPVRYLDEAYMMIMDDRYLSSSGSWYIAGLAITVKNGMEFYTTAPSTIIPNVSGMSDSDKYRVGRRLKYTGSFNHMGVKENLPDGISCSELYWEGSNLHCYGERIPYQYDEGLSQCTTLDDLTSDTHCRIWGIANVGTKMDTMIRSLCQEQEADGSYSDICNCYLPDDIYYDTIMEEAGQRVANGVKASSLLQCASGLCSGSGTIGEDIFYAGSRKCDVCIQVMTANINADKIEGGVSLRQQCTHVDATYTWKKLIEDLIMYGAYHRDEGIHRHIIINDGRTAIMLVTSTKQAKDAIKATTLLKVISDEEGYIIIPEQLWNQSPTAYSNEILSFMLEAK